MPLPATAKGTWVLPMEQAKWRRAVSDSYCFKLARAMERGHLPYQLWQKSPRTVPSWPCQNPVHLPELITAVSFRGVIGLAGPGPHHYLRKVESRDGQVHPDQEEWRAAHPRRSGCVTKGRRRESRGPSKTLGTKVFIEPQMAGFPVWPFRSIPTSPPLKCGSLPEELAQARFWGSVTALTSRLNFAGHSFGFAPAHKVSFLHWLQCLASSTASMQGLPFQGPPSHLHALLHQELPEESGTVNGYGGPELARLRQMNEGVNE